MANSKLPQNLFDSEFQSIFDAMKIIRSRNMSNALDDPVRMKNMMADLTPDLSPARMRMLADLSDIGYYQMIVGKSFSSDKDIARSAVNRLTTEYGYDRGLSEKMVYVVSTAFDKKLDLPIPPANKKSETVPITPNVKSDRQETYHPAPPLHPAAPVQQAVVERTSYQPQTTQTYSPVPQTSRGHQKEEISVLITGIIALIFIQTVYLAIIGLILGRNARKKANGFVDAYGYRTGLVKAGSIMGTIANVVGILLCIIIAIELVIFIFY